MSLGIGLVLVRKLDPTPPEQNLAWELASVVNLTRNALIVAQPSKRRELLAVMEKEEGVRVLPLEETDRVQTNLPFESKSKIEDAAQAEPCVEMIPGAGGYFWLCHVRPHDMGAAGCIRCRRKFHRMNHHRIQFKLFADE